MKQSAFTQMMFDFHAATKMGMRYTSSRLRHKETNYGTPAVRSTHGTRVMVIDPNNEAVYFWARLWKYAEQPAKLIRVDRYGDMEKSIQEPLKFSRGITYANIKQDQIFHYAHQLSDQSFLDFAAQHKFIQPALMWIDPLAETAEAYRYDATRESPFYPLSLEEAASQKELHDRSTPSVWDIDLVAFSSVHDASHAQGDIDQRIAFAESLLRKARLEQKPACITIAQSQTPVRYVPVDTLAYCREKTLEMVERVTR